MSLLFSEAGSRRLDEIVMPGMLCAFDFDGTLAPIVATPEHAQLPADVLQRLLALSRHAPVAVITGRSIADIRPRLGFKPAYLIGNHGLEGVPGWELLHTAHAALCAVWKRQLRSALTDAAAFDPAIFIEDKTYSLSVHYRLVRDPSLAERRLAALFATLAPAPHIINGKFVFNLLPPDSANKGSAFERLMQIADAPSAIYVGDDVTDEDVFRLRRRDVLSVRVEASEESAAEFFVPRLADMPDLIDELIRRLSCAGTLPHRLPAVGGA
jgi:trehalose 6-phosphate phosphatase